MTQGGALTGRRITVVGGTGFVGRHLVRRLAAAGARLRVVARDPERGLFLKPMGDPGQIALLRGSLLDPASLDAACASAEAVVNLVGILYESGRQTFAAIHAQGAGNLAKAAAAAGAGRFVQVSAIGATPHSPAAYARSKAAGEAAVGEAFAGATILRPSIVFGPEDDFFNRFAALARLSPVLPLIGGDVFDERLFGGMLFRGHRFGAGTPRFQPVYVGDVAEAIVRILCDPATAGEIYELGGPQVYSFRELLEIVLRATGRRRLLVPLPFWAAKFEAAFLERLPKPLLTRDQVKLLMRDNVVSGEAPGLAELGIAPTAVETEVPVYLARFRRAGGATLAALV
ncbi:MAG: complex I NDUFA9 subunit family protein [Alphaproteobacteria bacterium]